MEKEIDLFDNYELLPIEVQIILTKNMHFDFDYNIVKNFLIELKEYGYTFDYGLDAEPFDLKLMKETKVFTLKNNVWIKTEFNPEKKQICLYDDELKFKGIGII
jgi:hypothetical protein